MPTPFSAIKEFSAVIITGGSSGIGKSYIELLAKHCPQLAFCNISRRNPELINKKLNLRHIGCDLSKPAEVGRALESIKDFLAREAPTGRILLINNSGFGLYGRFPEPAINQQLEMIDLNIRAVVQLTGSLLPILKLRGGAVLTVASTAAFQPTPFLGAYGASKAFVLYWSLALNEELRGTGVRCLAVCPGPTSTDFFRRAGLAEGAVPNMFGETSEKVVIASLKALGAGRSMVVSGWKNKLMTALVTPMPKPLIAWLAGKALARYRMKQVKT